MSAVLVLVVGAVIAGLTSAEISCRNAKGEAVDWYIGYKLPYVANNETGSGFLYADMANPTWSERQDITTGDSAVAKTLAEYYDRKDDPDIFAMMYNDAHPDGKDDSYRGHSKGAIVFDQSSGFWMVHSVPKFPNPDSYSYPESGIKNGQSFICITFNSDVLDFFGEYFIYTMSSDYMSLLPTSFVLRYPGLAKVVARKSLPTSVKVYSINETLPSAQGTMTFTILGKHKKFDGDLYANLVAPFTNCSYYAETWPTSASPVYPTVCDIPNQHVANVLTVTVGGLEFNTTKDHSKWAVSETANCGCGYLCIGDINRQYSQSDRAGGTVCFRYLPIWYLYRKSVTDFTPCP